MILYALPDLHKEALSGYWLLDAAPNTAN